MKRDLILPVSVIVFAVAISTVIQGRLTERWPFARARTEKLAEFTERLKQMPTDVGPWVGQDVIVDEKEFAASGCDFAISRSYQNSITGEEVNVYLVSGVARHVTIHTPDWCYRGAGFSMEGDMEPYGLPTVPDVEFLTTTFRKEDPTGSQRLRIFWAFSEDGTWRGPRQPKPEYAGRPALYKVYLITEAGHGDDRVSDSPALAFAEEFMPLANQILFGKESDTASDVETPEPPQAAEPAPEDDLLLQPDSATLGL